MPQFSLTKIVAAAFSLQTFFPLIGPKTNYFVELCDFKRIFFKYCMIIAVLNISKRHSVLINFKLTISALIILLFYSTIDEHVHLIYVTESVDTFML